MANPILGALNQNRLMGQIAPIKNMLQNPNAMLGQVLQQNPQYSQVMNIIKANGGDPQKAFYAVANQLGVDGDEIIKMLK